MTSSRVAAREELAAGIAGGRAAGLLPAYIWLAVLVQRIAIPVSDSYVSPILPLGLVLAAWLWTSGQARLEAVRVALYGLAALSVVTATLVAGFAGAQFSLTSLGLLLTLYLPFTLALIGPVEAHRLSLLRALRSAATLVGLLAIGQFTAQVALGWTWSDLLAAVVPEQFLVPGYVTSYPIFYGSDVFKSNGIVMLEPSLCSQVLALGVLAQLRLGREWWRVALLGLAILTTVAGTGLIVLGVGLLVLTRERGTRWLVAGVIGLAVTLALPPVSGIYSQRLTAATDPSSSGYQRFIAPWHRLSASLDSSPVTFFAGSGAGSGQVLVDQIERKQGFPAIDPPQSKLITEYGWPSGLLFVAFMIVVLVRGSPDPMFAWALSALYFALGGGLLQAQTVLLIWVLTLPVLRRGQTVRLGRPTAAPAAGTRP